MGSLHFQVCHEQNIQCETEYFGLVFNPRGARNNDHGSPLDPVDTAVPDAQMDQLANSPGELDAIPRVRQWLNLRNPLGRSDGGFLSLALRVKFWVPVHLILQESVRNLFFMEARQELLENRIFAADWPNAIKLAALLAQADGVRFDPECLEESSRLRVTTSNSSINRSVNSLSSNQSTLLAVDAQLQRRRGSKRKSSEDGINQQQQPSNPDPISVYEPYLLVRPRSKSIGMSKEKLLYAIAKEHEQYADQLPKSAKYFFLAEFGGLKGFGEEKFFVPKVEVDGGTSQVEVTVGPEGLGIKANERTE